MQLGDTTMKYKLVAIVAISTGLMGAAFDTPADESDDVTSNATRAWIGFQIAPVALDLRGRNRELVGIGSYIVNAQGGCNDCHTAPSYAPGGNPFMGQPELINGPCYLAGGATFGPFTSRNLTPRANGLPAGRTLDQFKTLMRTGSVNGSRTLQVMPWPVYGKMSDREIAAIYEYLNAIPLINPRPAACTVS